MQFGDDGFDRRFYLIAPLSEFFEQCFTDSQNKRLVTGLFDAGVQVIGCDGKFFGMIFKGVDRGRFKEYFPALLSLLERVPRDPKQEYRSSFKYQFFHSRAAGAVMFGGLLAALGMNLFWWLPSHPFDVLSTSGTRFALSGFGLGLFCSLLLLSWRAAKLKHRAFAHYSIIRWASLSIAFLPMLATIALGIVNRAFDSATPERVSAFVINATPSGSKHAAQMKVAWYGDRKGSEIKMTFLLSGDQEYRSARKLVGGEIPLKVKPGFLGFPWVMPLEF